MTRFTSIHGPLRPGKLYGICSHHKEVVKAYMQNFLFESIRKPSEHPLLYMAEDLAIQEKGFLFFKSRFKYSATFRSRITKFIHSGIKVFYLTDYEFTESVIDHLRQLADETDATFLIGDLAGSLLPHRNEFDALYMVHDLVKEISA